MANGCSSDYDGGSKEHQRETRLQRKFQSNSSDTMLETLNDCIVFLK